MKVCSYERGNQNPQIEEGQTIQWINKKEQKGKQKPKTSNVYILL
jgi:hypothetical protein